MIAGYIKESAAQEGIDTNIKFRQQVKRMNWCTATKTWTLDVHTDERTISTQIQTRFLLLGTGYFDYETPLEPHIPGIKNFQGPVVHPQCWPSEEVLDFKDKNVVVIGSGATAITLLPALAETASHVTMLQRSPSYILSIASEDFLEKAIRLLFPTVLAWRLIRLKWIIVPLVLVSFCRRCPRLAKWLLLRITKGQLPVGMSLSPNFTPRYNPWEQRLCLCPDDDFYECIRTGKGSIHTGVIDSVTENAIGLQSGDRLHPDIIVTATGLKLRMAGGIEITVDDKPFDIPENHMWKYAMVENLPNAVFALGYVDASWTLGADATAKLACRLLKTMKEDGSKMVVPRLDQGDREHMVQEPFLNLAATYVQRGNTVFPKVGGRAQWGPRSYYWKDLAIAVYGDIRKELEWTK